MKTLKIELEIENTKENENNHEFVYALQEAIKQIEKGYTTIDLRNESIENGYCNIKTED